jgi:hypothetical protein
MTRQAESPQPCTATALVPEVLLCCEQEAGVTLRCVVHGSGWMHSDVRVRCLCNADRPAAVTSVAEAAAVAAATAAGSNTMQCVTDGRSCCRSCCNATCRVLLLAGAAVATQFRPLSIRFP